MQNKKSDELFHEIGDSISFNHSISTCYFVIESADIKSFKNAAGECLSYQLYGLELNTKLYGPDLNKWFKNRKPSPKDKSLKFFAISNNGKDRFFGETAAVVQKAILTKSLNKISK